MSFLMCCLLQRWRYLISLSLLAWIVQHENFRKSWLPVKRNWISRISGCEILAGCMKYLIFSPNLFLFFPSVFQKTLGKKKIPRRRKALRDRYKGISYSISQLRRRRGGGFARLLEYTRREHEIVSRAGSWWNDIFFREYAVVKESRQRHPGILKKKKKISRIIQGGGDRAWLAENFKVPPNWWNNGRRNTDAHWHRGLWIYKVHLEHRGQNNVGKHRRGEKKGTRRRA